MSKYRIVCYARNDKFHEYFVTHDSRVWPCTKYTSPDLQPLGADKNHPLLEDDPYLKELMETDPDWNNLDKRNMNQIMSHPFFVEHISEENWKSDFPPDMCRRCCHQGE